jgi:hypothetical protein
MPSTNQCIGSHYDELKQRVFYFNYNSAGYHGIYSYDVKANTISPLLISFVDSQEDIFDFDPKFPIASINILYRTEEDGDVLHWTDRKNRPMKLNIKEALATGKTYGNAWKKEYLTVARKMPTKAPVCNYSDTPESANNLRSKLFQFSYRWVYNDNTRSTYSPWSKLFAPFNINDLTADTDVTKNNVINVLYNSGAKDCYKIEISARESIGNAFSDRMTVAIIDKAKLSIPDNTDRVYNFFNDGTYPFADTGESFQLFDYVPKKANTQELLNGNILVYGGITEGNTFSSNINVTNTVDLITPVALLNVESKSFGRNWRFIFSGVPTVGDKVTLDLVVTTTNDNVSPAEIDEESFSFTYTAVLGDTSTTIKNYFKGVIDAETKLTAEDSSTDGILIGYVPGGIKITWSVTGEAIVERVSTSAPTDLNISAYKHSSTYRFGLVYFDEFGVTNGVVTSEGMKVVTPALSSANIGIATINTPNINFEINHAPPVWAKTFSFVRTKNLSVSNFVWATTNDLHKKDEVVGGTTTTFGYMDISVYNNNKNGFPSYEYQKGDRVRIYGTLNGGTANQIDLPILDVLLASPEGGTSVGYWLKVPYDLSIMSLWDTYTSSNTPTYYIEPYSPYYNAAAENQFYYEFGENYSIITGANNNLVHESTLQTQIIGTGARPAKYTFSKGDVYNRRRNTHYIIDMSISDKFASKLDGNGRALAVDEYAKEVYYPTLVRYSGSYEQNTNINNTNRFAAANLDEYDRQKGDIQRLKIRGQQLKVFQNRACGLVPVLQNVLQTADGGSVVSQSTEILNSIQYYQGDYGIGEQYCSLASSANADYFTDPILGCQIRLSADGMTSISEIYKAHFFLTDKITKYQKVNNADKFGNGGYAKVLGVYDSFEEEFVTVMQGSGSTITDYTFGFSEPRNAYSAFYDYNPEWITVAGNVIISWKSGELWVHNNTTAYANFYGVQQTPSIKLIFNQNPNIKKHYNTLTTLGNTTWTAPLNSDIVTNMNNNSKLLSADFKIKDDKYHASFKRDVNSTGGLYEGKVLKGSWLELNLKATNPQNLVDLYYAELGILQPLNNR